MYMAFSEGVTISFKCATYKDFFFFFLCLLSFFLNLTEHRTPPKTKTDHLLLWKTVLFHNRI